MPARFAGLLSWRLSEASSAVVVESEADRRTSQHTGTTNWRSDHILNHLEDRVRGRTAGNYEITLFDRPRTVRTTKKTADLVPVAREALAQSNLMRLNTE
jgi:hypothetical protein